MANAHLFRLRTNPFFQNETWEYSFYNKYLNDPQDWIGIHFQAPQEDFITHVGLRIINVKEPCPTYRVSLRKLQASGLPSDAVITSQTITPDSSWNGTFQWIALLTPYTVTRGEKLCIVVDYVSGAIGASNYLNIAPAFRSTYTASKVFYPYYMFNNGGSIERGTGSVIWGMKSAIRCYGFPFKSLGSVGGSSPIQAGLRLRLDPGWGSTATIKGAQVQFTQQAAATAKTVDLVLYSNAGELIRVTFPCDITKDPTASAVTKIYFPEPSPSLAFGKEYFLVISPNQVDTGSYLRTFQVQEAFDMTAWPGSSSFYQVDRAAPGGEWARTKSARPMIHPIFDTWIG